MLGNNTLITGGSFVQTHGNYTKVDNITHNGLKVGGFERLQMAVASSAFHNSAQRLDPPKCHAHTREAVLRNIMNWLTDTANRQTWILWLNGAAGAGKSAIAQSIAELCQQMGVPLASFFFFRTDSSRNRIRPLVATLAYQLALNIPEAREAIASAIEHDPLVLDRSFESQFTTLVIEPLQGLKYDSSSSGTSTSQYPFVFIIDGLDECNERSAQTAIIRGIASLLGRTKIPMLFLVASRPENHLTMAFNSKKVQRVLNRLALDHKYLPDADIRLFLQDKFAEIKETHPLADLIYSLWPEEDVIEKLVKKSSGQFIYASVVINFLSSPSQNPVQRLQIVQGLQPVGKDTPFAQLDALYRHIFSTVSDLQGALRVLAYSILAEEVYTNMLERILHLPDGAVRVALADLTSVLLCKNFVIKYLHASLPDFLLDPARSQEYYINPANWNADFACHWYQEYKMGRIGWIARLIKHLKNAAPTLDLRRHILQFQPTTSHMNLLFSQMYHKNEVGELFNYLSVIEEMAFEDNLEAYNYSRGVIVDFAMSQFPEGYSTFIQTECRNKLGLTPQVATSLENAGTLTELAKGANPRPQTNPKTSQSPKKRPKIIRWIMGFKK